MYFHTDSPQDTEWLANVLRTAADADRRVRFNVTDDGSLMVKIGEGAWTPPIAGTPDPYRDQSQKREDYLGPAAAFVLAGRPVPAGL